ncbi:hypothetical protein HPB50_029227 [Hyalomma asiaticum]|nr:hypothetical protein HPB50_029227 [Hyalomma asiaticum]
MEVRRCRRRGRDPSSSGFAVSAPWLVAAGILDNASGLGNPYGVTEPMQLRVRENERASCRVAIPYPAGWTLLRARTQSSRNAKRQPLRERACWGA